MNCAGINHFIAPYQERTQIVLGISVLVSFLATCILINLCGNLHNAWSQASGPLILTGALTLASLALFAIASCLPNEKYLKDPADSASKNQVVDPSLIKSDDKNLKEQIDLFINNRAEINTHLPQGVVNIIGSYATSLESYFLGCPTKEDTLNKFKEDLYHLCTFADEIGSEVDDGFSGGHSLDRVLHWQRIPFNKKEKILNLLCHKQFGLQAAIRLLFNYDAVVSNRPNYLIIGKILGLNDIEGLKICFKVYGGISFFPEMLESKVTQATMVEFIKYVFKSVKGPQLVLGMPIVKQFIKLGWVNVLREIFYNDGRLNETCVPVLTAAQCMHEPVTGAMLKKRERGHLQEYLAHHLDEADHIETIKLLIKMGVPKDPPGRGGGVGAHIATPLFRAERLELDPAIIDLLKPETTI